MKTTNSYQEVLTSEFFDKTPKAVFAAMAVSYALRQHEDDFRKVQSELLNEWRALHDSGIIPQKPLKVNFKPYASLELTRAEMQSICSAVWEKTKAPFNLEPGQDFGHVEIMIDSGLTINALFEYADTDDKEIIRNIVNSQVFGINY